MWKVIRLTLSLLFFVPGFALAGAFAALDNGERTPWGGVAGGAAAGLFFGLVFGGFRPRWFARLFGPEDHDREAD